MRPKERVEVRRRKLVEGVRAEQMVSFRCCLPPSPAERCQIVRKILCHESQSGTRYLIQVTR